MTYENLKERLLSFNLFDETSKYFDDYIKLIINNLSTEKQKNCTECHHIIPKNYYKKMKIEIDNSNDNLVNLMYCDHVLAHCYLALSSNVKWFISANLDAIYAVFNNPKNKLEYSTLEEFVNDFDSIKDILKCNHTVSDEQKEKISAISSASRWYNNGIKETFAMKRPKGDNWTEGRIPMSESGRKKVSENSKKSHWYNDGIKSYFTMYPKDNYVRGRLDIVGNNNPSKRDDVKEKISKANKK